MENQQTRGFVHIIYLSEKNSIVTCDYVEVSQKKSNKMQSPV